MLLLLIVNVDVIWRSVADIWRYLKVCYGHFVCFLSLLVCLELPCNICCGWFVTLKTGSDGRKDGSWQTQTDKNWSQIRHPSVFTCTDWFIFPSSDLYTPEHTKGVYYKAGLTYPVFLCISWPEGADELRLFTRFSSSEALCSHKRGHLMSSDSSSAQNWEMACCLLQSRVIMKRYEEYKHVTTAKSSTVTANKAGGRKLAE